MENNNLPPDTKADHNAEDTTYDLFMMIISFVALIIMVLYILPGVERTATEIAFALDTVFSLIFLYDFFRNLAKAPNKSVYFFKRGGWLDLLGSLPAFPILRLLRIARVFRIYRSLRRLTLRDLWRNYRDNRTESAFWTTLLVTLLMLTITSLVIIPIEAESPDAQIRDSDQALWWSIVTITTVGYGDLVPVTNSGRTLAAILMTIGVALVSVLTSYVTTNLMMRGDKTEQERKKRLDEGIIKLNKRFDHLEALIEELKADQDMNILAMEEKDRNV